MAAVLLLAAADVGAGPHVQFYGSLVIGPFLAGAMVGAGATLAVAVFTLAVAVALGFVNDGHSAEWILRVLVVSAGGALAVWLAAKRARREAELAQVTHVAEIAQRAVLTSVPSEVGPLRFASRYQSATKEALIGGDFFEVIPCDGDCVRAVVGDVRGKGIDAVRLAAIALGAFRETAAQSSADLVDVARRMDQRLARHLEAEDFVTAVLAEFGPDGSLEVVNCGHHPPLLVLGDSIELLSPATSTTPLGLDPVPVRERATMAVGDRLLLYTDGLVEARTESGRMIALDRLTETLRDVSLDNALGGLLTTLQSLALGPLEDDLALVLAEYRGPQLGQVSLDDRIVSITTE